MTKTFSCYTCLDTGIYEYQCGEGTCDFSEFCEDCPEGKVAEAKLEAERQRYFAKLAEEERIRALPRCGHFWFGNHRRYSCLLHTGHEGDHGG